jgi:hypothetical protein
MALIPSPATGQQPASSGRADRAHLYAMLLRSPSTWSQASTAVMKPPVDTRPWERQPRLLGSGLPR